MLFLDDDDDAKPLDPSLKKLFCGKQQQKNSKQNKKTETVSRLEAKRDDVARRAGELRTRE